MSNEQTPHSHRLEQDEAASGTQGSTPAPAPQGDADFKITVRKIQVKVQPRGVLAE